jgi:predicted RNA-binding protein with PUA-like domain
MISYWIEKTNVKGRPDRQQGDFAVGKALWSPQASKRGSDIYRFMRDIRPDDVIFHLTDSEAFTAVSRAQTSFEDFEGIPGTEWGRVKSYLVRLKDRVNLIPPLVRSIFLTSPYRDQLERLIDSGTKNLFYDSGGDLHQGAYLTPAPSGLIAILNKAYQETAGKELPYIDHETPKRAQSNTPQSSFWLFQANPKFYDLRPALRDLKEMNWTVSRFKERIKIGDKVYLWESGSGGGLVGVAEISKPAQLMPFDENERPYLRDSTEFEGEQLRARLKILRAIDPPIGRQALLEQPELRELSIFKAPQGTNFHVSEQEAEAIDRIIANPPVREKLPAPHKSQRAESKPMTGPTIEQLAQETNLTTNELREIESLLKKKRQIILEGPPGSGKTFVADFFAHYFSGNPFGNSHRDNLLFVQFHQSYGYEDFIQGIRPLTNSKGQLEYHVRDGIFKAFCDRARGSSRNFVAVVDEINRGNISRIFGELLFLLEYRERNISLPYDGSAFSIPPNVYIIGTMNTTDRSLAQIDYALRRRFFFYRLMPVVDGQAPVLAHALDKLGFVAADRDRVVSCFLALNDKISKHLGPNFQIGHSHFIDSAIASPDELKMVWDRAVIPLLEEYFYNSRDREKILSEFTLEKCGNGPTQSS